MQTALSQNPTLYLLSLGCPKNRVDSEVMLGVATENAVPTLKSEPVNANTLRLSWQGDTTGWILQENTTLDEAGWTNSTAPVTQTGQLFQSSLNSGARRCFYRLVHP